MTSAMFRFVCVLIALGCSVCRFPVPKQLFNGRDLQDWAIADAGNQPGYAVEDGLIKTRPGGGFFWYTGEKIGNSTIRVVYRMTSSEENSGIFIRIPSEPSNETFAIHHGIEVQIDDRADDWHCTGVLYSMTKALARPAYPSTTATADASCSARM
jgi:hypothetical protein